MKWSVVYKRAILPDGSLLFPERLTHEFLEQARRDQGSYVFANQYQNEIIPEGEQTFQKSWLRYYHEVPEDCHRFAFIDPAISEAATADYTALVVVAVDANKNWFVEHVSRQRINPSEIIELAFKVNERYQPQLIGFEDVAFQKAIVHFAHEEMRRRNKMIPLTGVKRGVDKTKEMRILGLVPRFEWGTLLLGPSCHDLVQETAQFPRGAHDDCLDALASIEEIVYYPSTRKKPDEKPSPADASAYESWYIKQLGRRASLGDSSGE